MKTDFTYHLPKKNIIKYGVNGALVLADLENKHSYWSDIEMLNDNEEFFTTLQDIQCSTKLGINTIKRILPTLNDVVEYEVRKDRITKHTKNQLTYYFRFIQQNPDGLVNDIKSNYISGIAGKMTEQGYHFLLTPIPTENIDVIVECFGAGLTPKHLSEHHMMGKIHTLEQIEAVYEIYYK